MNAPFKTALPKPHPVVAPIAVADAARGGEPSVFDCSPEHHAQIAQAYPNFGKASPARRALYEAREAYREGRARSGCNTPEAADEAVRGLTPGLLTDSELVAHSRDQRKFNRQERRAARKAVA